MVASWMMATPMYEPAWFSGPRPAASIPHPVASSRCPPVFGFFVRNGVSNSTLRKCGGLSRFEEAIDACSEMDRLLEYLAARISPSRPRLDAVALPAGAASPHCSSPPHDNSCACGTSAAALALALAAVSSLPSDTSFVDILILPSRF